MSRIDDLKADQRATLQLLLKQGRSYDEIAGLLRIETRAVRERARSALDALGPEDVELELEDQDDVADYLLGQQSASRRAATRELLERSPQARAWARIVASELRPMAGDTLPEIPAEGAEVDEAFDALQARTEHRERTQKSSRVGGLILLFAIALLVAGVLALVLGGNDDDDDPGNQAGNNTQTQTQPGGEAQIVGQANLTPPSGESGENAPSGVALITREGNQYGIGVRAVNLPQLPDQNTNYAVWFVGPSGNRFAGYPPRPGEGGALEAADRVEWNPTEYRQVRITRETGQEQPRSPGETVLRGNVQQPPAGGGTGGTGAEGSGGGAAAPEGGAAAPEDDGN